MHGLFAPNIAPIDMTQRWTEVAIRRKRFDGVVRDHTIAGGSGLFFRVTKHGSYWKWRGSIKGQTHRRNLGTVRDVPLAEALSTAKSFSANIKNGLPPEYGLAVTSDLTFEEAYFAYITSEEFKLKKPAYQASFRLRMEKWVVEGKSLSAKRLAMSKENKDLRKNKIGGVQLAKIDQTMARSLWSHVVKAGNPDTARLIRSHSKVVTDWACHHLSVVVPHGNPFNFSTPRVPRKANDRVFSLDELRLLIDAFRAEPDIRRQFFNVCLLTGWRNGEVAKMRWEHIEYGVPVAAFSDNDHRHVAVWNSAPEANKSNQRIRFVLSDLVLAEINSLPRTNQWVFSYDNRPKGGDALPMHPPRKRASKIMSELEFSHSASLHALRHTMVTLMKEQGFSAAAIDRFLGKTVREGSASHAVYNHADTLAEKLEVADGWQRIVTQLGFR